MLSERAKKYAESLRNAAALPINESSPLRLPDFFDHEKFRRSQKLFRDNIFSVTYSLYLGAVAMHADPSILNIMLHPKGSFTSFLAYRRCIHTLFHAFLWIRGDIKPGSKAWKSIEGMRKVHAQVSQSANLANAGEISQKDLVITLYGFLGFTILSKDKVGFHVDEKEIEDYCHFFKVVGYLSGIKNEYNAICGTMAETLERLEVVRSEFLRPALESPSKEYLETVKIATNGISCFNPRDSYDTIMFAVKRLVGVPNYYYTKHEIPKNYDTSKLEIYNLGYFSRIMYWSIVFTHEYLLRFKIVRFMFNMQMLFLEFLMHNFPILAIFRFGWNRAWESTSFDSKKHH